VNTRHARTKNSADPSVFELYPPTVFQKLEQQREQARAMTRTALEMYKRAIVMSDECLRSLQKMRLKVERADIL